jgi:RNA polymerase sigma-70 factor (ECF subfamily)
MSTETAEALSFETIVDTFYSEVYGTAYRLTGNQADADDLVQETFTNVLKAVKSGSVIEYPKAYLITTLKNTFFKHIKDKGREQSAERIEDYIEEHQLDEIPASIEVDSNSIQEAISKLEEKYRMPLVLFYFNEFSYQEISEVLDVPIGTVMSRLARGKRFIKLYIGNTYGKGEGN